MFQEHEKRGNIVLLKKFILDELYSVGLTVDFEYFLVFTPKSQSRCVLTSLALHMLFSIWENDCETGVPRTIASWWIQKHRISIIVMYCYGCYILL